MVGKEKYHHPFRIKYLNSCGRRDIRGRFRLSKNDLNVLALVFYSFLKKRELLGSKIKDFQFVELSLFICGRTKIKNLNKQFRNKEKVTDVLSFPLYDSFRGDKNALFLIPGDTLELGDIFVCLDVAKKQAKNHGLSIREEVLHLLVHGFLHICGYDHELSLQEEKIMEGMEVKLIEQFRKNF